MTFIREWGFKVKINSNVFLMIFWWKEEKKNSFFDTNEQKKKVADVKSFNRSVHTKLLYWRPWQWTSQDYYFLFSFVILVSD